MTQQDRRVWALEQLIRKDGCLDPRMYECAYHATSERGVEDVEDLYTLWVEWKGKFPSNDPKTNRL
tara:strand:- start:244 stop:441 length:198 start_codon:yes stop_codon:yes gene_type:complete